MLLRLNHPASSLHPQRGKEGRRRNDLLFYSFTLLLSFLCCFGSRRRAIHHRRATAAPKLTVDDDLSLYSFAPFSFHVFSPLFHPIEKARNSLYMNEMWGVFWGGGGGRSGHVTTEAAEDI